MAHEGKRCVGGSSVTVLGCDPLDRLYASNQPVPPSHQDFHYPLFMTLVHIIMIFWLSTLTRGVLQWWTGKPRVVLSWNVYLTKVAPTGDDRAQTALRGGVCEPVSL